MHLPSPEAVPSLSGSPVPRPLAPLLTAVDGGQGGRGGLPTPSSTAPRLEACCGCGGGSRGGCRGPPSATTRAGGAATGGRVEAAAARRGREFRSPQSAPVQPGTAGPGYRLRRRRGPVLDTGTLRNRLCRRPYVNQTQPEVASWTTSVDIARPRDRAITFVARGGEVRLRYGALLRTSGS